MRKVFGIGLSKTGTVSLHKAFTLLGMRSVHLRHAGVVRHGQVVLPGEFADYDAGTDICCAGCFEQSMGVYSGLQA